MQKSAPHKWSAPGDRRERERRRRGAFGGPLRSHTRSPSPSLSPLARLRRVATARPARSFVLVFCERVCVCVRLGLSVRVPLMRELWVWVRCRVDSHGLTVTASVVHSIRTVYCWARNAHCAQLIMTSHSSSLWTVTPVIAITPVTTSAPCRVSMWLKLMTQLITRTNNASLRQCTVDCTKYTSICRVQWRSVWRVCAALALDCNALIAALDPTWTLDQNTFEPKWSAGSSAVLHSVRVQPEVAHTLSVHCPPVRPAHSRQRTYALLSFCPLFGVFCISPSAVKWALGIKHAHCARTRAVPVSSTAITDLWVEFLMTNEWL